MKRYNPIEVEKKWQKVWDEEDIYRADLKSDKRKYIAMSMFNYPSGAGIHIGHAMNYTISDVMARFKRQQGYESYHPVGWDSFGLPAENYAIKTGITPQASMEQIIPGYHKQYKAMGWSNDWSKEIASHQPDYYKWSQWLFEQIYKNGLAYQDSRMQWWCDKCQTVLANEQVIDGKCWRHDSADDPEVYKREVKQWFFKITDYAEEMLDATDALDWSEVVKVAQKNWIGKSQGAEIDFKIAGDDAFIKIFTTRPDTICGATYLVLAPEHPMVSGLTTDKHRQDVDDYLKQAAKKTEVERLSDVKEKTGVFTGSFAINPATGKEIPIWVADYVLYGYGTGAIMAVPAHDERDYAFAEKFDLPIVQVIEPQLLDNENPPREGAQDTERNVVMCVIKHPKENKYLTLRWNKLDWHTLVMGGIEEGEDFETAGRREIQEETGYTDLTLVKALPLKINSKFYAKHKELNRSIHTTVLLFQLNDVKAGKTNRDAIEDFEIEWTDYSNLHLLHPVSELPFILKWLAGEKIVYTDEGTLINSGSFDGMESSEAREEIVAWLESQRIGNSKTTFKIRDWSVSRQRYWGAPIPIINCPKHGPVLVPEKDLPVLLPELTDFAPSGDGRSALARATEWLNVKCPICGGDAQRETDTMDTYICSSWYFLRYFDPHNDKAIFDSKIVNKWMPIDFYNGGDHATAHMIYARFITRFLNKIGLVDNPEPFKRFLFNGKVTASDGTMFSKSKGNGVDPLEIINSGYGADALRTYLMFAAPLELWIRWDPQGVPGTYRFLNRIWNLVQEYLQSKENSAKSDTLLKIIHPVIKKVAHDLEEQKYNTAIAAMMKACNELYEVKAKDGYSDRENWQFALESLVMLVAPFAPYMAEELWHQLGHEDTVHIDHWPMWDDKYLQSDSMTIVVQVNGKLRAKLEVAKDTDEDKIKELALNEENVKAHLGNKKPAKVIYVLGRLVNVVV